MKAAVVGLGIGHAHCAGYLEGPHSELAAVCDLWPERLARVGGTFAQGSMTDLAALYPPQLLKRRWQEIGVKVYSSLAELLRDDSIEVISLCTPDHTHAELAVEILRSGRHLLLEKPLALSLPDAEAVGEAAEAAGVVFSVGYEFRLNPAVCKVRRLVADGVTGPVEAFTLYHFRRPFKRDKWQRWIQKKATSGGLIVEETSHWLDLLRFLTGKEVGRMCCHTTAGIHSDFDYEDIAFIEGTLQQGGIFQISHALSGFDFNLTITVHGRNKTVWCHLKDRPVCRLDAGRTGYYGLVAWGNANQPAEAASLEEFGPEASEPRNIKEYVKHFCECIVGGKSRPSVTPMPIRRWSSRCAQTRTPTGSGEAGRHEQEIGT